MAEHKACYLCSKESSSACSKCKSINYCGKECQKLHWPVHKTFCGKVAASTSDKYVKIVDDADGRGRGLKAIAEIPKGLRFCLYSSHSPVYVADYSKLRPSCKDYTYMYPLAHNNKNMVCFGNPNDEPGCLINDPVDPEYIASVGKCQNVQDVEKWINGYNKQSQAFKGGNATCKYDPIENKVYVVSTKKIKKGEDIFICYGTNWLGKFLVDKRLSNTTRLAILAVHMKHISYINISCMWCDNLPYLYHPEKKSFIVLPGYDAELDKILHMNEDIVAKKVDDTCNIWLKYYGLPTDGLSGWINALKTVGWETNKKLIENTDTVVNGRK